MSGTQNYSTLSAHDKKAGQKYRSEHFAYLLVAENIKSSAVKMTFLQLQLVIWLACKT
jgi:hypothetical protein